MQIHRSSFAIGLLVGVACLFSLSAYQVAQYKLQLQPQPVVTLGFPGPVQVEGIPTPQQMMRVVEGQPFTVPMGSKFVCMMAGAKEGLADGDVNIVVNGQPVVRVALSPSGFNRLWPGYVVDGGDTVEPMCVPPSCNETPVLLGYLWDGPSGQVKIEGVPSPDQMLSVAGGAPLTVPAGKVFVCQSVVTRPGLGSSPANILIDGQPAFSIPVDSVIDNLRLDLGWSSQQVRL